MNASQFFGAMFDPFRRLTDFSSRSTRPEFWPFIFLMIATNQLLAVAAISPSFLFAQRQALNPDIRQNLEPEFESLFKRFFILCLAGFLIFLLPLCGAVVRRLHDTNRSGFWALPSAILLIFGFAASWFVFNGFLRNGGDDIPPLFFLLFFNNFAYIATLVMLIVFCVQDGTAGRNRFGLDPQGRDSVAVEPQPPC